MCAQNSILSDKESITKIEFGLDSIYNFQFNQVDEIYEHLDEKYPDHPLPPLFNAIIIYWQHFPVTPNSPYHRIYMENITQAISDADLLLDEDPKNPELLFMSLMARLLVMQYYADNDESSKVIPYVRKAYKLAKKGFALDHKIQDFQFITGLYNYYREAYPEKHPVYKPMAYFFPEGNKELGIKQLENNWHHGIFLDAESLSFLVYISLNYEGNYKKSARYTKELHKLYPNNPLFLSYRIRSLLLQKKYNKALPFIQELETNQASNDFFKTMSLIYRGIYEEKKNKNFIAAEVFYQKAIDLSDSYKPFINSRISYAYFGLARICKNKDRKKATSYRKKAMDLSSSAHLNFD
ncbi:MAG: hypothetical protein C0597_13060 [Marinilabiliales bacterium]|nr:MAG: hypothetical protein C0597_13060 [Marinilabiliales bacterium]